MKLGGSADLTEPLPDHRRIAGNWTFLVVTDRQELDWQIYKNFAGVGAGQESRPRALGKA
jgi:type I site-specific restriction-modification system R (restriction) subunit